MYEHAPTVRRFLRGWIGDPAALDDATQETFTRAWVNRRSLREEEKLVPWLLGIARLISFEHHRRTRRFGPLTDHQERTADQSPDPESTLAAKEVEGAIGAALLELEPARRRALLLRVDGDLSYEEIGRSMGWSVPKVKNEIHRARSQLRALLAVAMLAVALIVGLNLRPPAASVERDGSADMCMADGGSCEMPARAQIRGELLSCLEPEVCALTDGAPICR